MAVGGQRHHVPANRIVLHRRTRAAWAGPDESGWGCGAGGVGAWGCGTGGVGGLGTQPERRDRHRCRARRWDNCRPAWTGSRSHRSGDGSGRSPGTCRIRWRRARRRSRDPAGAGGVRSSAPRRVPRGGAPRWVGVGTPGWVCRRRHPSRSLGTDPGARGGGGARRSRRGAGRAASPHMVGLGCRRGAGPAAGRTVRPGLPVPVARPAGCGPTGDTDPCRRAAGMAARRGDRPAGSRPPPRPAVAPGRRADALGNRCGLDLGPRRPGASGDLCREPDRGCAPGGVRSLRRAGPVPDMSRIVRAGGRGATAAGVPPVLDIATGRVRQMRVDVDAGAATRRDATAAGPAGACRWRRGGSDRGQRRRRW